MPAQRSVIDGTLIVMVVLLAALAALAYAQGGRDLLVSGLGEGGQLLLRFGLVIAVSFFAAGLVSQLIPADWVREQLGADSGARGLVIAMGAGMVTPAGPFVSMPIAAVMLRSGAGAGPVVAFLAAWSLLAVHRLLAWEVPILGWRFALLRYATCLALPFVAGLVARALTRP
ncbi:MAG: permease [Myxococcota bacterium]